MAAANELTWDTAAEDGGARRPSLEDLGGAALEDDENDPPPDTGEMHYALMDNQVIKQAQATAKVAPGAIVSVTFSGSTPSITKAKGPGGAIATTTFTPTDNGVGDTSITHAAGALPPQDCEPEGTVNGATPGMISVRSISNGVRVVTKDKDGNAVDLPFTVRFN